MKYMDNNSQRRGRRRRCCFSEFTDSKFLPRVPQFLLVILVWISLVNADSVHTETQAMMYLSEYGYLSPRVRNPQSGHIMSDEMMSKAIMEFQAFASLNLTGYLDEDTLHTMSLPRCGVRDKVGVSTYTRSKRYVLQGSRWKVRDLTYRISKYPRGLSRSDTDEEVARAFQVWADVTPLTFSRRTSGQVHIDIRFEVGEHGDGDPFDGPGGTLAHAFFPIYGGDAHFDDSEKWSIRSHKGTNLFQVAAHEFGHSLGLSHSDVRSALMAPFYRGYDSSFSLDSDDVEGIQTLYGSRGGFGGGDDNDEEGDNTGAGSGKPTSTVKPPTAPNPEGDPELCNGGTFDTIFNSADGSTFVFKGEHYWKLMEDGIEPGYPKLISKTWPGLPSNIDAAFTYKNSKTYFFKGSKYWKYADKKMDGDYPKEINDGFTGIPDNVQAAMVWSGNGKIYFFKGSKFWRFDPAQKPPVKSTYPKPITNWEGIPDNIDDALHYTNGYTYFFKGGQYWRFNDKTFTVDTADPPFPRNAGHWWFGCKAVSKQYLKDGDKNELRASASEYSRPSISDLRREQHQNQNTDVGDIVLDADKNVNSWRMNETSIADAEELVRYERNDARKTVTSSRHMFLHLILTTVALIVNNIASR